MRVFLTGATGFVGSAVTRELLSNGHQVVGLARTDEGAAKLKAAGAQARLGSLEDLEGLKRAAQDSDGVIHCAFIHDFSNMAHSARIDNSVCEAFGEALAGSGRPLVITSGTAIAVSPGSIILETSAGHRGAAVGGRALSEDLALALTSKNVRGMVMRLPPSVHDKGDHGFVPELIRVAREKGEAAYVGDGSNRWPAVHRLDAARAYRLAFEKGLAGHRYHAVGEQGMPTREIAEVIGKHLNLPVVSKTKEEAPAHFGWIGHFFALDCPASSDLTQSALGWKATHLPLQDDMAANYFTK